jgi:hypothetical protein
LPRLTANAIWASSRLSGAPKQVHVADRFRSGGEQEQLGVARQQRRSAQEAALDASAQRAGAGYGKASRELVRRHSSRQLEQRQRVAVGLLDDPVAHVLIKRRMHSHGQQVVGIRLFESGQRQRGKARELAHSGLLTKRDDDGDSLGRQPPSDERDRLQGRVVQPLRVIDETEQRVFTDARGQQTQGGQADEEPVRDGRLRQA